LGEALGQKEAKRLSRILIIEDSALIAALLEELVLECGCDVVRLASNIESARLAIAKCDYDALMCF
jgi:response regulator of citrate/malate metabolism